MHDTKALKVFNHDIIQVFQHKNAHSNHETDRKYRNDQSSDAAAKALTS